MMDTAVHPAPTRPREGSNRRMPPIWRTVLALVNVGKGAVAGAGLLIGSLGAVNIILLSVIEITNVKVRSDAVLEFQTGHLLYFAIAGAIIGGSVYVYILARVWRRMRRK